MSFGANPDWHDRVADRQSGQDAKFAKLRNQELNSYRLEALSTVRELLAEPEVRIRCYEGPLIEFLDTGLWPNAFMTAGGVQTESLVKRRTVEHLVLNVPVDCNDDMRPAYGYIVGNAPPAPSLDTYGAVEIHVAPSALGSATVCCGDSLMTTFYADDAVLAATPLAMPTLEGRHAETDCLGQTILPGIVDPRHGYAEAQIYGLVVDDIEFISVPAGVEPSEDLLRAARDREKVVIFRGEALQ